MAHYAFLDENFLVTEVIVGRDESNFDWETYYANVRGQLCKRTSFNTHGGVHSNGGTPLRKNYAGIGYTYDVSRDAFIPPKPFPSWALDEDTCLWGAPVPMPEYGKYYVWDETQQNWIEGTQP
jgi:hypothetical protein